MPPSRRIVCAVAASWLQCGSPFFLSPVTDSLTFLDETADSLASGVIGLEKSGENEKNLGE
jgi:hypothetical protein